VLVGAAADVLVDDGLGVGGGVREAVGRGVEIDLDVEDVPSVGAGLDVVGLGGVGGLEGRGGLVPPLVGVLTWLPSQYTVNPSRVIFLSTVLIPFVPAPLQYTEFIGWFTGLGYSMWKTGLLDARKLLYVAHSPSWAHCSLTAKSIMGETVSRMSRLFFKPIFMPYADALVWRKYI
jgi:hypothetical protein